MTNTQSERSKVVRRIPTVNELLESPPLKGLINRVSHTVVVNGVRSFLADLRVQVRERANHLSIPPVSELAARIAGHILADDQSTMRPVINATGIMLPVGLGGAPLAEKAIVQVAAAARGYASVDVDLASDAPSEPADVACRLLCRLTGSEAALVVNSPASSVLLALAALANARDVVVSRGELIEIEGGPRLTDLIAASGACPREVGTTNRTRWEDYRDAIGDTTAALLRVHASEFRMVGSAARPALAELVELSGKYNLPLIDAAGPATLIDLTSLGLEGHPNVRESIAAGASLVLFSGGKLLGGPECGVIVGESSLVEHLARHPLAPALRADKLTVAALAATLRILGDESAAARELPLLQLLAAPAENLRGRAERIATQIANFDGVASAVACESVAFLSGAALPSERISSWCVAVEPARMKVDQFARKLRIGTPSVMGRVGDGRLRMELRSVFPRQDAELVAAVCATCG